MTRYRWIRTVGILLAVSYGIGAPFAAYLEYHSHVISEHFGYPPWFLYAVSVIEFIGAVGVLIRPLAPWAAGGLTLMTLGAMGSHLKMGTPVRAIPALLFTILQVWYGIASLQSKAKGKLPSASG